MPRRFLLLDAIRGIAALLIVIRHTPLFWNAQPFQESYLAVDLFFCLSGFVLAQSYGERLRSGMTAGQFMTSRFVRLYPLYILGTAIGIVAVCIPLMHHGQGAALHLAGASALAVLGLPSPLSIPASVWWATLYPLNGPAWSLLLELAANFVFAVLVRRARNFLGVCIGILLLSVWGLLLVALVSSRMLDSGYDWPTFWMGWPRVGWSFFVGIVLHAWYRQDPTPFDAPTSRSVAPLVLLAVALTLAYAPAEGLRRGYDLVVVIFVLPACVYLAARCQVPAVASGLCAFLGAISYAAYVIHEPLGRLTGRAFEKATGLALVSVAPWGGFTFIILLVSLCLVLDRYYDLPVRRAATAWLALAKLRSRIGGKVS
jgi:peptidoglycan/LPS O-acetylase OafA/YrhL